MYLPYSHYKSYKSCNLQYFWTYIEKKIPKKRESIFNTVFGNVLQKVMEIFFNEKKFLEENWQLWMENEIKTWFPYYINKGFIDWEKNKLSESELLQSCLDTVPFLIKFLNANSDFITTSTTQSEIEIVYEIETGDFITGRLDFIVDKYDTSVWILDGKGSLTENYLDDNQIFYYCLLYYLKFNKIPAKAGFIFWRTSEIKFLEITQNVLDNILNDIKQVILDIKNKKFEANPSHSNCYFCKYKDECLDFISFKNNKRKSKLSDLPEFQNANDFFTIGF